MPVCVIISEQALSHCSSVISCDAILGGNSVRRRSFVTGLLTDYVNAIRKPLGVDYARLLLVSAIWGSSFICIDIALADFSPLAIACWRILIASLGIAIICRQLKLTIPLDLKTLAQFALIGTLNSVVPFTLIGWGQQSVNSAVAALLIATTPFSTLIMSHFMTGDDRFSMNRLAGLLIGFSGVAVLFIHELVFAGNSAVSMLAILLAAVCYSLSSLYIRRLSHLPGLVIASGSMLVTCVVLVPLLLWHSPPWQQSSSAQSIAALVFLAIGPTAIAHILRTQIVQTNGAVFMSNAGYLIPVFATLWSWLFLSEWPSMALCVAIILIFAGIYLGQRGRPVQSNPVSSKTV